MFSLLALFQEPESNLALSDHKERDVAADREEGHDDEIHANAIVEMILGA